MSTEEGCRAGRAPAPSCSLACSSRAASARAMAAFSASHGRQHRRLPAVARPPYPTYRPRPAAPERGLVPAATYVTVDFTSTSRGWAYRGRVLGSSGLTGRIYEHFSKTAGRRAAGLMPRPAPSLSALFVRCRSNDRSIDGGISALVAAVPAVVTDGPGQGGSPPGMCTLVGSEGHFGGWSGRAPRDGYGGETAGRPGPGPRAHLATA